MKGAYRGDGVERGEELALKVLRALQDHFFLRREREGWREGGRE